MNAGPTLRQPDWWNCEDEITSISRNITGKLGKLFYKNFTFIGKFWKTHPENFPKFQFFRVMRQTVGKLSGHDSGDFPETFSKKIVLLYCDVTTDDN